MTPAPAKLTAAAWANGADMRRPRAVGIARPRPTPAPAPILPPPSLAPPKPVPMPVPKARPIVIIRERRLCPVTAIHCMLAACAAAKVTKREFEGRGRLYPTVLAREVAVFAARQATTESYPRIARVFGTTNHSTVITAHGRAKKKWKADEVLPESMRDMGWPEGSTFRDLCAAVVGDAQRRAKAPQQETR